MNGQQLAFLLTTAERMSLYSELSLNGLGRDFLKEGSDIAGSQLGRLELSQPMQVCAKLIDCVAPWRSREVRFPPSNSRRIIYFIF